MSFSGGTQLCGVCLFIPWERDEHGDNNSNLHECKNDRNLAQYESLMFSVDGGTTNNQTVPWGRQWTF